MNRNTLDLLSDAISEVGSWHRWLIKDDTVQVQFCDVLLYDETTSEKGAHTTDVLAVRFIGHSFAVFLDDLNEDDWYRQLRDEESVIYPVDTYELAFDDIKTAESVWNAYTHQRMIKDLSDLGSLSNAKHFLSARCGDVGFIVGGDEIEVVGRKGKYTEEEIETASGKWWDYWKAYWRLRGTKDAYLKDYACEITIPVTKD